VHRGKFYNIDFDRQRIIGNYIVDFYAKDLGLIIKIDGSSHNDKDIYDEKRELYLKSFGLLIYRISTIRILHDLGNVMQELESFVVGNYSKL
jgi:very-short-patch-repair endonuclease